MARSSMRWWSVALVVLAVTSVVPLVTPPPAEAAVSAGQAGSSISTRSSQTRLEGLAAGAVHSCSLTGSGGIDCWGSNSRGQIDVPDDGPWLQVSAGYEHTCGLRVGGTIDCWGNNDNGQAADPTGGPYTAVSAGYLHTCAVTITSGVECWGDDGSGQASAPPGLYKAVATGDAHSCGLTVTSEIVCWGADGAGQSSGVPDGVAFRAVAVGGVHSCGIRVDSHISCWGLNDDGQAIDLVGTTFQALELGYRHTCAITTAGTMVCIGANGAGQTDAPAGTFTSIAAGEDHTCALSTEDDVICWGSNSAGQADNQTDGIHRTPAVSVGGVHTCALTATGAIDCFGADGFNEYGQDADRPGPFTAVSAGVTLSCGLLTTGDVECWGENASGQAEPPPGPFVSVSAGWDAACGLRPAGTITCWGATAGAPGEFLDVNSSFDRTYCGVLVAADVYCWGNNNDGQAEYQEGPFLSISMLQEQGCGLSPSGSVHCWGNLDGVPADHAGPYLASGAGWLGVACGFTVAGAVDCWGDNTMPPNEDRPGPYSSLDVSGLHACGVTAAGVVDCWGDEGYGRLGGLPAINSPLPSSPVSETFEHTFTTTATEVMVTWVVTSGSLPPGLDLDPATGVLSGTPTTTGHYPFTVGAWTVFGTSTQDVVLDTIGDPPGTPTAVTGLAGDGAVFVTWDAPVSDGGSPITGYTVTADPGGATCSTTGALDCVVLGLTNGTAYTFTVIATNANGDGPPSEPSDPVTPVAPTSAPDPPTDVVGVAADGQVDVSWAAPALDGGAPITGYTVTADPGGATCTTTGALTCPVAGLTNGTAYTFTVVATNAVGDGPPSAPSDPVTPRTVPGSPTGVAAIAGNTQATVSWDAPVSDGGSAITGYTVTASPGGATCTTTGVLTCPVTSLSNGSAYTFTVVATNAAGDSPPSAPSSVVRPASPLCAVGADGPFPDVPASHPFCVNIEWLVTRGITTGFPDNTFKPTQAVSRQAMAAFLYRFAGEPDGPDPTCDAAAFPDVPVLHPFCGEIAWLVGEGITSGFADGTFKPTQAVSRQAMAAFLYRFAGDTDGPHPTCTTATFSDIPASHPFCGEINWLVGAGITTGYADGTYRPGDAVSRQAMAAFLNRLDDLLALS